MKKNIKNSLIITILFLLVFILKPLSTNAMIEKSSYINVKDELNMDVSNILSISLNFSTDNIINPNDAAKFGLVGEIENKTFYDKNYKLKVSYYDEKYDLLAENEFIKVAKARCINCNSLDKFVELMSDVNSLNDKDISKIIYYMITIDVDEISPNTNNDYDYDYDYTLNKYDVNIKVNENNTYDIKETINAYFNVPRHGIYKIIPYENIVTRLDNTKIKNKAKISNIYVNDSYSINMENNNYIIQIGSSSKTFVGEKEYIIKYNYNIGNDKSKKFDEFYFNIIGTEWDTQISNITFSINMPKEFDKNKLGFSKGEYGIVDSSDIEYEVNLMENN